MHQLKRTHNIAGYRDHLAGQEVHAGDLLELYDDGLWVLGRYEYSGRHGNAWFYFGDDRVIDIDRERMRFRWPPR